MTSESAMLLSAVVALICILGHFPRSIGHGGTDLTKSGNGQLLLLSTLDGTIICVEKETGHVRWKIKDEPVVRMSVKGDQVPMPLFLPDPKDGSLYMLGTGSREAVKKLPFTIPQMVASSPCRSSDGIIYTGKKLDTWFSVNPQTGVKRAFLSYNSADLSCPREGPKSIFIGRTEYNLVMMDPIKNEKAWNVTFYDYNSYEMDAENVKNYDYVHFTGSSSGRVVTLQRGTDSLLWQIDHDSPVIAIYLLEPRGLSSVPFTNVAESVLDQLISEINKKTDSELGVEFKMSELKLFPTLYIGKYVHGLYALPSLADKITATIAFDERRPLLLEGPAGFETIPTNEEPLLDGKFRIIRRKYSISPPGEIAPDAEELSEDRALSYVHLGHYNVPKVNNYVALQIEGRSDLRKIIPNDTGDFAGRSSVPARAGAALDSVLIGCGQFYDVLTEIISLRNASAQQLKKLMRISWEIFNLAVLQQENLVIKVTIAILVVFVITMAWHFNKQMKDIQQLSQSSKTSDSGHSNGITAMPIDMGFGVFQIGKIRFDTCHVLGKGCEGTLVFKGEFDARSVAVKRILPECFTFADREVELLRESDQHANVIRYFCMEQDKQFRYIALELCACTLQEYVDLNFCPGFITNQEILYQASCGLEHLHKLNIVHRDIKPSNVLLSYPNFHGDVHVMISDFGLCKKLKLGRSSFSKRSGIIGTDGWIAPEMLTDETRTTCLVDVFSLGCLYYYVLTNGRHPFGDTLHRQANIISGNYKLNGYECEDRLGACLIENMINREPGNRPVMSAVLKHPIFWNESKILAFFQDVSDRIEKEDANDFVIKKLERGARSVVRNDWRIHIDEEVAQDLRRYRNYRGNSVRDLLRAMRNKKHHYRELPLRAQMNLGEIPEKFVQYWTTRFPLLLIHTWLAMQCVKNESIFSGYYDSGYSYPDIAKFYTAEESVDHGKRILGKNVLKCPKTQT